MKIIFNSDNDIKLPDINTVVTVGSFDGIHLAHKRIIEKINKLALLNNFKSLIFTFLNHPRSVFSGEDIPFITTLEQKKEILEKLHIDYLFLQYFDKKFAENSAEDFIKNILIAKLKMKILVIGDDHRLGKGREGSYEHLKFLSEKYDFKLYQIDSVVYNGIRVSSTNIRKAIINGDIVLANSLLGYEYFFDGIVVGGSKIGRDLGFPTANISLKKEKLMPKIGVYAVSCRINGNIYYGMANLGYRPTINQAKDITFEVNIFDFDKDIYHQEIRIFFLKKIRDEMKFASKEDLIRQLHKDKKDVLDFISTNNYLKKIINFS
jgi:riboflavin kinase/FMN adenylyltransferase